MIQDNFKNDLINKLDHLIEEKLLKYDLIVPIARRGVRTLELSNYTPDLFHSEKILFFDSIWFHLNKLKGKKIVLFDESVRTGKSLLLNKNDLEKFLKIKGIKTAALLVHKDVKYFPDHYPEELICNENLYERLSDELIERILSDGKPLDVHHPIFLIDIQQTVVTEFLTKLKEIYGHNIELQSSGCFGNTKFFTLDFQDDFDIPHIEPYPHLLDEGPKKIRLFIKGNIIRCVPIVYPCLDISEEILKKRGACKLKKEYPNQALCSILNSKKAVEKDYKLQSSLCYTCIVNELNCRLIGQFFKKLTDENIPFKFQGLDKIPMKATYYDEEKKLVDVITKKINSIVYGGDISPLGLRNARKCVLPQKSPINRNYLINIRPEMEVSLGILRNINLNNNLFLKERYYPLREESLRGLSYEQIRNIMSDMGEFGFSEGMDIGLDVGYLKPFNTSNGINIKPEGEKRQIRANMRLYTTASEHVRDGLKIFANFVIPKEPPNEL